METYSHHNLIKTARITGFWYLILAISGISGFLFIHPQLFVPEDPAMTLANLKEKEFLMRLNISMEFTIVVSQALTAYGFYKLFRRINPSGAWALGIWGMINAVIILISALSMGAALGITQIPALSDDAKITAVQLLELLSKNAWDTGGLFFGLWLIPMGSIVAGSQMMPVWLGRILMVGGIGYIVSTFLKYLLPDIFLSDLLVIPATAGELWMVAYLLIYGIRPSGEKKIPVKEENFTESSLSRTETK